VVTQSYQETYPHAHSSQFPMTNILNVQDVGPWAKSVQVAQAALLELGFVLGIYAVRANALVDVYPMDVFSLFAVLFCYKSRLKPHLGCCLAAATAAASAIFMHCDVINCQLSYLSEVKGLMTCCIVILFMLNDMLDGQ
jgi:hypothetical protein